MPIEIRMPALSPTMTEGTLAKWLVKEGTKVSSGDIVCEIETDKATMEVEAVDEGTIGKILVAEGTREIAVNSTIAVLLIDDENSSSMDTILTDIKNTNDNIDSPITEMVQHQPFKQSIAEDSSDHESAGFSETIDQDKERIFASPLARRLAKKHNLDLHVVKGSGPNNRIVKRDIELVLENTDKALNVEAPHLKPKTQSNVQYKTIPNSSMRKVIAQRLTKAAQDIPHFNISADINVDRLLEVRNRLNIRETQEYKISINDFIIKAAALALKRVPECNVSFNADSILFFNSQDIAVAVAVDGGLVTPVIIDAASKGLGVISIEMRELASKARQGKLLPDEYTGGTFTISNLGMYGIKSFNSIINAPQGAILSVGASETRPVVIDNAISIASMMTLTLAVDHRCIDGANAALFVGELKKILEEPLQLML